MLCRPERRWKVGPRSERGSGKNKEHIVGREFLDLAKVVPSVTYLPAAILSSRVSSAQNSLYFVGFDFRMVSTFDVAHEAETIMSIYIGQNG